jgi:hypothetical protein
MNVRRTLFLVAVVLLLGTGLTTWRYLAGLQSAVPSARMPAPASSQGERIAKAVSALPSGTIAIHVPQSTLRVGDQETVRVVVHDGVRAAIAGAFEDPTFPLSGEATVARLAVSEQMNAQLYGDSDRVKITPLQSSKAFVVFGPDHAIEWRWIVKPVAPGAAGLSVAVTAKLDADLVGSPNSRVRVAIRDVPIQATTSLPAAVRAAIEQNWTWLWAAIVVPGADAAWAWYRRRRENDVASTANA